MTNELTDYEVEDDMEPCWHLYESMRIVDGKLVSVCTYCRELAPEAATTHKDNSV